LLRHLFRRHAQFFRQRFDLFLPEHRLNLFHGERGGHHIPKSPVLNILDQIRQPAVGVYQFRNGIGERFVFVQETAGCGEKFFL
jgi:hypothetical protein